MEGDFEISDFYHKETYDPETGLAKSFVISKKAQQVNLKKLGEQIAFNKGESIYMEQSQKYDLTMIEKLAQEAGFQQQKYFFDKRKWFVNALWVVDK